MSSNGKPDILENENEREALRQLTEQHTVLHRRVTFPRNFREWPQDGIEIKDGHVTCISMRHIRRDDVPSEIRVFSQLERLAASDSTRIFPDFIFEMTSLRSLRIASQLLNKIPDGFASLKNLTHLDLKGVKAAHLSESIGNLDKLEYLSLESVSVEGVSLTALPNWISKLRRLKTLDLRWNKLVSLPDFLDSMHLETILLDGMSTLPDLLTRMPRLQAVTIHDKAIVNSTRAMQEWYKRKKHTDIDFSDLEYRIILHSAKHTNLVDLFSRIPSTRQFLEEHLVAIYENNLWREPYDRYHLILPSTTTIRFKFTELSNGYMRWFYYTVLYITCAINSDDFRYDSSGVPFDHLIWRWKVDFADFLAGKTIKDQFINCGCGYPDDRGENWILELREGQVRWAVSNFFKQNRDTKGESDAYVYFMPLSMFLEAWIGYFTSAKDFFTRYLQAFEDDVSFFDQYALGKYASMDPRPRYKQEVEKEINEFLNDLDELVNLFRAASH